MVQTTVSIRMDDDLKKQMDKFCQDVGMTLSTAVNLYVKTVVREQKIPFDITTEADPFYSDANFERLKRAIADVEAGRSKLTEHELIEASDD